MDYPISQPAIEDVKASKRVTVPAEVYPYRAGVIGGLIAGAVMTLVMAGWGALTGQGIWLPVNLIAATVLPDLQAAPIETLAQFHPAGLIVGTLLHVSFSVFLGLLFSVLLPTLPGSAFFWALIIGPFLWFVAQYLVLPILNPRMQALIDIPSFAISHVIYSLILGYWVAHTPKASICDYSPCDD